MADNRYAFIQRIGADDEILHLRLRPVWRSYWKGFILIFTILSFTNSPDQAIVGGLLSGSILASIIFRRYRRLFTVTSKRLRSRIGLISNNTHEVLIRHGREFRITQGMVARVMQFGTFEVSTAAGSGPEVIFTDIGYPNDLKEAIRLVRNGQ